MLLLLLLLLLRSTAAQPICLAVSHSGSPQQFVVSTSMHTTAEAVSRSCRWRDACVQCERDAKELPLARVLHTALPLPPPLLLLADFCCCCCYVAMSLSRGCWAPAAAAAATATASAPGCDWHQQDPRTAQQCCCCPMAAHSNMALLDTSACCCAYDPAVDCRRGCNLPRIVAAAWTVVVLQAVLPRL